MKYFIYQRLDIISVRIFMFTFTHTQKAYRWLLWIDQETPISWIWLSTFPNATAWWLYSLYSDAYTTTL